MQANKPNHVCRNPGCHNGEDGGRLHYYSCNACDRRKGIYWREWCCSIECYQEWMLYQEKEQAKVEEQAQAEALVEEPKVEEVKAEEPRAEEVKDEEPKVKSEAKPKKIMPEDSDDIPEGVKFVFGKKKHRD